MTKPTALAVGSQTINVMRTICFVTGTRAEFGLMIQTLRAIQAHDDLNLQIVATGMHVSATHGNTLAALQNDGWNIDRVIDWTETTAAAATGLAMAGLAAAFADLAPDIVLVVGDRVEAFAAAAAAHLSGLVVAHVHGGDRAMGQADDALRHAITKLAHLHFPATPQSAARIENLGEQGWRIHQAGAPGIDGIAQQAASSNCVTAEFGVAPQRFALLVYHPTRDDDAAEHDTAARLLGATLAAGVPRVVVVYPNNDPGHRGVVRCWDAVTDARVVVRRDVPRPAFLGLMRDAAFLIGNSSGGIIEAASFGTPVLDVGPRQLGREHGGNVRHVADDFASVTAAIRESWNDDDPPRWTGGNAYGGDGTGRRIADVMSTIPLYDELRRKLIAY